MTSLINDTYLIDPNNYECNAGLILPLLSEATWPKNGRRFLYLVGMLWCFLGVAIVADVFMCAIEKITSKTKVIRVSSKEPGREYDEIHVKVWNNTVANLTLMALGSSAPEILLSVIEICGRGFKSGDLGPATIVGSASFNLFVITAICVVAIPRKNNSTGETGNRRIKSIKVFMITAFFSIFAYVWLIIILVWSSPNVVDLWEAVITLMMFPLLVMLAYFADCDFFMKKRVPGDKEDDDIELGVVNRVMGRLQSHEYSITEAEDPADKGKWTSNSMREMIKDTRRVNPHLKEEELLKIARKRKAETTPHSRMWYRINALRAIGGREKLIPTVNEALQEVYAAVKERNAATAGQGAEDSPLNLIRHDSIDDLSEGGKLAVVEFVATESGVMEAAGNVKIALRRHGNTKTRAMIRVETVDGTAEADKDYNPVKTTIVFEPNEVSKTIDIGIIDDNEWELNESFFVKLSRTGDNADGNIIIGKQNLHVVTIIDDDEPGTFEFSKPSLLFKESAGKAIIPIERTAGADGRVEIGWQTTDMTACSGRDYEGGNGTIIFEHGEITKNLEIIIYDDEDAEKDECFKIQLQDPSPGAKLGKIVKTIITIVNDDEFNGMVSRLTNQVNMNTDAMLIESQAWGAQIRDAMNVNGGDIENATSCDYFMHFLTFPWKILFALIPPTSLCGGWLAFFSALALIGLLTAIIGDLATIFGCLVGLKDPVTAITFVALGTSLPDLFASKQAAQQETTADNSCGNVTGSNSVNVFLGLGLPWVIATIYWTAQGKTFTVDAGTLTFSVGVYCVCAVICITVLFIRRYTGDLAELGGRIGPAYASAALFATMWFIYIILSSLQAYGHIDL